MTADVRLLFVTRAVRTFAYGLLAVILALFLSERGFSDKEIGLVFSLTLVGDAVVSLGAGAIADRLGRRRVLAVSSALIVLAGALFVTSRNPVVLVAAAVVGTISPSGAEVGPFLSIEQAAISQGVAPAERTRVFGVYQLVGSLSNATGALAGGWVAKLLTAAGYAPVDAQRAIILLYAVLGLVMAAVFSRLSPAIEVATRTGGGVGLHRSRRRVLTLAALFSVDSFGSGLAVQTLIAYWLYRRFGADLGTLGSVFFAVNAIAGVSALLSAPLAKRVGLVNTMVFTHLPGNLLLIAFPFMPSLGLAVGALLCRFLVAQMDVPARTSYMMAIVADDERSAASAIASQAKLLGASLGPLAAGLMGLSATPFVVAGVLKIGYDLSLWRLFRQVRADD